MLDQATGMAKDVAGKFEDAYGAITGDIGAQAEGKMSQAAGKLQKNFGEAVAAFLDTASNNPVATLAVVAGAGFLLGVIWSQRD
jgi:uncharacterized protein YjbJ (UPF0337 family)